MSMLLIVGNGLTIDFAKSVIPRSLQLKTKTSEILNWQFPILCYKQKEVKHVLPELHSAVKYVRNTNKKLGDFDIIEFLSNISTNIQYSVKLTELMYQCRGPWQRYFDIENPRYKDYNIDDIISYMLRLYLYGAFIWLDDEYKRCDASNWLWNKWFEQNHWRLEAVISFNYELVLERSLKYISPRSFQYILQHGCTSPTHIPVIKPHGSINFRADECAFKLYGSNPFDGSIFARKLDVPITVIDDWTSPNVLPDLILPKEYSYISSFKYVSQGYEFIKAVAPAISECVIVGLSYWEHDRPELNAIFQQLRPQTKISVVNPSPSPDLIVMLKSRFKNEPIIVKSPLKLLHK